MAQIGPESVALASGPVSLAAADRANARRGAPTAATPPTAPPAITLDKRGGDAWAWEKRLTGVCSGFPPEAAIGIRVGPTVVAAERDGDAFAATVQLEPGSNEVVSVATLPDGTEVVSAPVVYDVKLRPRPTARLVARVEADRVVFDATGSTPSDYDAAPIRSWRVEPRAGNPARLDLDEVAPGIVAATVPTVDGEFFALLTVEDGEGRRDRATAFFVVEAGVARAPDPVHARAAWIAPAVVYGVVPRTFDPPGFAGVAARLDDLRDLGVGALWFSPITRTPSGRFGYEVTDYFDTNPAYGTLEEFKTLVDAAHERGLRVLMDVVPNHTSVEHPCARDGAARGEASASWDFYDRDAGGIPTHYFDWTHLPNLNFDHPEVRRFVLEALTFWVREVGVDGFRIDAVWGIQRRRPEWLTDFLVEMNRIKPDALLIAEAGARDPFWTEQGFDAAYDWTAELGHWAWEHVFGGQAPIGEAMVAALTDNGKGYHPDALVMRFLNNNDTGDRFVTTHGLGSYKAALAMLLTLPGLPCLFTGDEVGAEFRPYDDTGSIAWSDRNNLRPYVKELIALRRGTPALHGRQWLPLAVKPAVPCFGYLRFPDDPAADPVVVLLNFSAANLEASVTLPAAAELAAGGTLRDLMTEEAMTLAGGDAFSTTLPGWGFRVLAHDQA
ncbi:MAG: GH13 / GH13_36 / GH13_20 / GH13_23 / GH13_ 16 / GH13_30 / GH13_17 / GH13_31 / GH13_2 / GH13 _29 / GH13_40 / GH13_10 / GH13_19 / GH13_35 / GH1 3_1 / GH13_37 / GH13_4 / GH13_26 / GH13_8 / GH13 _11 / GH13_34 / GH13_9 / GH13_21 [uncultured Thermomicrobiales bacterium]|uniref:Glycosyl hydrolase family 13 catalytic domain-containing protein n=1 Tax=uncultured Thermomicrobiales bacterium TaxID=1645740 RepID=A0A6J4VLL2_9BACT|nr:MAG: GH13 / GH13_36 / GH13_20 / GH13_23 / GH13_ 16 / GH13_30 / GH13_17 / GH13_31 / GH13_2 / GH13 _29 / GH13_40 / GH13_10 / GH13_19 / GH13_35 / GH1 3_1 / GH13_37 / GH13_4 / GH13_26 / GH13_8 / GH13 _11 / GH13_34 / GH13_9 / GH13_21 [uncultured Thermomicrobiales bacterium]